MAEDVLLLYFPNEVLEHILEDDNLSFMDVYNFGSTCLTLRKVINGNKLWKVKFRQRWPHLNLSRLFKGQDTINWKEQFKHRFKIGRATINLVKTMSSKFYSKEEICNADFSLFLDILPSHPLALRFMIDELMLLIHNKDTYSNLTNVFYGKKVLRYLRHIEVAKQWENYKTERAENQLLERGAVIVAQWCQTDLDITDEYIGEQLDEIANWVRSVIRQQYGDQHPALSVPPPVLEQWRTTNICDNQYSPTVSRQIIKAVSEVLFNQMGFHGDSEMYYLPENSYINKVLDLRQGIPITLSIVFESVTRRLGIKCESVSFPGHFLLRWRDHYDNEGLAGQPQYIDVFNGGEFLTKDSCPNFNAQSRCPMSELFRHGPASAIQVVERMANNLEVAGRQRTQINGRLSRLRTVLELLLLINPANLAALLQLARLYMLYNLDNDIVILLESLNNLEIVDRDQGQAAYVRRMLELYLADETKRNSPIKAPLVCRRSDDVNVSYAVGMVMHHRRYDYFCVIFGWDSKCMADADWRKQMRVNNLPRQDDQPFYNVLVSDGSTRYAAEDNLEIAAEKYWIDHQDIGRYFDTFCGTYYLPNKEKESEYPDDAVVRETLLVYA